MNIIAKRRTVEDLLAIRNNVLKETRALEEQQRKLEIACEKLEGRAYPPYRLQKSYNQDVIKLIDYKYWRYIVKYFRLSDFMLCSEFEKLQDQIEHYSTPEFNEKNVLPWVDGMKGMIQDGVIKLAKKMYEEIINTKYRTGGERKKRNNNGIENHFILETGDCGYGYGYSRNPTITDDLEKLCYILDGEKLPEHTMKAEIFDSKNNCYYGESKCPYFRIKVCKNQNTHYWLTDETVLRLNKIGSNSKIIGSDIKIKVF